MRRKWMLAAALVACGACSVSIGPGEEVWHVFSFEQGLEGWTPARTDIEVGNDTIPWSIQWSHDRATDGGASLELYMHNLTDAGKIWVERAVRADPDRTYRVHVEFDLATADYGDLNHFTIIAGAVTRPPRARQELEPAFQGKTGNGSPSDVGYKWLRKSYDFTVRSGPDGKFYVVVGVWGTWEAARTYYIDALKVAVEPA